MEALNRQIRSFPEVLFRSLADTDGRLPWLLFWPVPILKLKIVGTASFLRSSLRGLKAETNELLAEKFCLKLSFVKWSVLRNA